MKAILITILSICPFLLMAQSEDTLRLAQKEALGLLNSLRINYDSIYTDCLNNNVIVHFKRDHFGSLYFCNNNRSFKLGSETFFNDDIIHRLSLLLDDEYEQFEIDALGEGKHSYRFNMSIVVWMVVLSGDDMLIKKMIENYTNGIYSDKVNHLIKISLASVGYQPFKENFIKTHTYDSAKSGDELNDILAEISNCFLNNEGLLLSANFLLSDKQTTLVIDVNCGEETRPMELKRYLYNVFYD